MQSDSAQGRTDGPTGFDANDHRFMSRALRIASRVLNGCDPNPRVGCVLVAGERVVGEGYHARAGGAHAEVVALAAAGDSARGAIAYVTLEPCAHTGRTPPCSRTLIEAGIGQVVFAMRDPDPRVAGRGAAELRRAGIDVREGLLADRAAALNPGFLSRIVRGRPRVRAKLAVSLDGRTAMADGESRWITGAAARRDVHRLRASSSAVMTGVGTVLADDPSLTVRDAPRDDGWHQPARIVVDSRLRLPPTARVLAEPGETFVLCGPDADTARRAALETAGAVVMVLPAAESGRVDPAAALTALAAAGVNEVLLEAGPTLQGAMLAAGLIDEIVVYLAPHLMGTAGLGMFELPALEAMADRVALSWTDVRVVGDDLRVTAVPRRG